MLNRFFKSIDGSGLRWVLPIVLLLSFCGCGDFFAQKPAELQTQVTINELKQIKENPAVKNPLPELYRSPPKRIKVKDGVKLFYFTKQHTVDKLSNLITAQLGLKVTPSNPTNQLIIHCPNDELADKTLEFLNMVDVPPIQVNIDCLIIERFADVTMDWETTLKIDNFLGEEITFGGKTDSSGNLLPNFPGASMRESKRSDFGLDFGYWRNQGVTGHEFRAIVDVLISKGYLKILMNPKLETLNGKKATITSRDYIPTEKIVQTNLNVPYSITEYKWVMDSLEVTPYVFADGSIGLATKITLGASSKPQGVVQLPIITERAVDITENRLKPGDSLIIGGMRKTEERAVIRGVPFFKDIPLLGILFSSKDYEESGTEVIFILTPSISSGGMEYTKMIEQARKKLAPPKYDIGLGEVLTDPLGIGIYTEQVEQRAAKAEFERLKSEIEKAEALEEVDVVKYKLLNTAEQVLKERTKAAQAQKEARAAKAEAEKVKAEAEKAKAEAIKARQEAEKAKAEAEKAKTEKAQEEAEKAKAKADVEKAKQEADKAKAEAEKAKKEAKEAKSAPKAEKPETQPEKTEGEQQNK